MSESEPQGVMAALGDAGPCPEVAAADKTWLVGHPTQRAKGELEKLVVQVAMSSLADLKGALSKAEWLEQKRELDGLIFARQWQTWGTLWSDVCNGPLSFPLFLLALLRERQPEAALADARRLWLSENGQCRVALAMVVPGFFDLMAADLPAEAEDRVAAAGRMKADFLASLARPTLSA